LGASFVANGLIFGLLQPSGQSLFSNSAFYIFAVLTAIVYWVWDSVSLQRQSPATEA
ncbi:UPF0715 family protein, partial [Bacillus amyloliquefaciens]|uniref:UPF0715 family protein n=1 Tax=Bacillus amyloliquefaciens TaxID=1390 RepID=UPI002846951B